MFTRYTAGPACHPPRVVLARVWSSDALVLAGGHSPSTATAPGLLEGHQIVDEVAPLPGEVVVDKYGYGSFHNTLLEDALRAGRGRQVWLVGTVTQICVEETVREGFRRGFEMVVVADGVSSFDAELHRATLRNLAQKFALVSDTVALIEDTGESTPRGDRLRSKRSDLSRRAMESRNSEPVDVLIIGAGASGGVVARRLAEAGIGVVCLEQGDWHDRMEYRGAELDWELTARKQWSGSPNIRGLPEDYPVDDADSDLSPLMFAGVGGSMLLFAGAWPRLLPSDFRVRSLDGVADDWPLTYDELQPVLRAQRPAHRRVGSRRRPGLPAGRGPAAAAAADRRRRAEGRQGPRLDSAGTGGRSPTRSSRRPTTGATRASNGARACRAATRARRPRPT